MPCYKLPKHVNRRMYIVHCTLFLQSKEVNKYGNWNCERINIMQKVYCERNACWPFSQWSIQKYSKFGSGIGIGYTLDTGGQISQVGINVGSLWRQLATSSRDNRIMCSASAALSSFSTSASLFQHSLCGSHFCQRGWWPRRK